MAANTVLRGPLIKLIYRPGDTIEGHIVCNMLRSRGVDAILIGEYQQGGVGELMPSDFASIKVPEEQLAAAKLILSEYEQISPIEHKPTKSKSRYFLPILVILVVFISISIFSKLIFMR